MRDDRFIVASDDLSSYFEIKDMFHKFQMGPKTREVLSLNYKTVLGLYVRTRKLLPGSLKYFLRRTTASL